MKRLLIVSGGGDPESNSYRPLYEFIRNINSENHFYDQIEVMSLPGHFSYNSSTDKELAWNCEESAELLKSKMILIDSDDHASTFNIFARSGGCFVTLMALEQYTPLKLSKIACWGPSSFDNIIDLFLIRFEEIREELLKKGLIIDKKTFHSFIPFDELVKRYKINKPLFIGFGKDDIYSGWDYADKINEVIINRKVDNIKVIKAPGEHNVTSRKNLTYLSLIF